MKDQGETPLMERKVVRRGLMAGLAGLGAAALLKSSGAGKAEANGENWQVGVGTNPPAPATGSTGLQANVDAKALIIDQKNTGFSATAIYAQTFGSAPAVEAIGAKSGIQGTTVAFGFHQTAGVVGADTGALDANPNFQWKRGVYGSAEHIGVHGRTTDGSGVAGEATGGGNGVTGYSNAGASSTQEGNGAGIGVRGKSGSGPGVKGESSSGPGVLGTSVSQPGIDGVSTNNLGIRGTSTNFVGVVGISTNSHGLYGSTQVGANGFGIVAENLSANGPGLFVNGSAPSQILGGLQVFGPKNAVLKMQDGSFASVYCQESPEPYFEDFGRAQLVGGVASVALEREFATLVAGGDYMVFTHPEGDTRGLYISRRTPAGFEVREVQGGTGNVPFTYRIVTRRKDIEGKRFAHVDTSAAEKVAGVRAVLAAMGTPGPTSGPSSGPSAPLPTQPAVPPTSNTAPPVVPAGPGSTIVPPGGGPSAAPGSAGR